MSNPGKYIAPAHKSMSRMLGHTLTVGDVDAWLGFRFVAMVRLSAVERAALAWSMLTSLTPHDALEVATSAIGPIGSPLPSFLGGMDDARHWATYASRDELKAHALAAYEAMTPQDQAAFYQHISEVEIAA